MNFGLLMAGAGMYNGIPRDMTSCVTWKLVNVQVQTCTEIVR